jgi:hypothetical protein
VDVTVTVVVDAGGLSSGQSEPADLVSRYQEYVERKAASSHATRESYSRLLDRVASGDVDPKLLDRGLNWFWHAYGPDHAIAISELTMRFFTEVVRLTLDQSRALINEVAPDTAGRSHIEPPGVDPTDWTTWLSRLIDYAERERSAQRDALASAIEQAAAATHGPERVDANATDAPQKESSRVVERLASLSFEVLAGLDSINDDLGLRYLTAVVPDDRPDAVELSGALGESVDCRFVVSNDKRAIAAVQCEVTEMRREDGIGPAFEPSATVTPDGLRLPPDGSAQISCSIALTDLFVGEATYLGELRVLAGDDAALRVPIRIRVTERGSST